MANKEDLKYERVIQHGIRDMKIKKIPERIARNPRLKDTLLEKGLGKAMRRLCSFDEMTLLDE